jgi:hypothetical protein
MAIWDREPGQERVWVAATPWRSHRHRQRERCSARGAPAGADSAQPACSPPPRLARPPVAAACRHHRDPGRRPGIDLGQPIVERSFRFGRATLCARCRTGFHGQHRPDAGGGSATRGHIVPTRPSRASGACTRFRIFDSGSRSTRGSAGAFFLRGAPDGCSRRWTEEIRKAGTPCAHPSAHALSRLTYQPADGSGPDQRSAVPLA